MPVREIQLLPGATLPNQSANDKVRPFMEFLWLTVYMKNIWNTFWWVSLQQPYPPSSSKRKRRLKPVCPRLCRNSGIGNPACRYRVQLNQFLCRRRHRFRFPLRTAPCFCTQQRTETGNHSRNELFQKTGRRTKGTYDILANSTVVTTEYKDSLLFTRPIILNKQVLVQRKPEKKR